MKKIIMDLKSFNILLLVTLLFLCISLNAMSDIKPEFSFISEYIGKEQRTEPLLAPKIDKVYVVVVKAFAQQHLEQALLQLDVQQTEQRRNCLQRYWDKLPVRIKNMLKFLGIGSGFALVEVYRRITGDLVLPFFFGGAAGMVGADIPTGCGIWTRLGLAFLGSWGLTALYWYYIVPEEPLVAPAIFLLTYMAKSISKHLSKKTGFADIYIDKLRDNMPAEIHHILKGDELV